MNDGKSFEHEFKENCEKTSFFYMRLVDSAKWTSDAKTKFTPSNPCDSVLFTMPFLWLLELKSTKGASISFNPYEADGERIISAPWEKPTNKKTQVMIKANQVRDLLKSVEKQGVIGGFILNYRPRKLKAGDTPNKCYFIHIKDFIEFAKKTGKSSISELDCKEIAYEIKNEIKKVKYKYDIEDFANGVAMQCLTKGHIDKKFLQEINDYISVLLLM